MFGAFLGAFLGALLGEFSFAFTFALARDVEWRAVGKLTFTFTFTLVSTWWGSNGVFSKRREVVIVLLGGIVRDGAALWECGCVRSLGGDGPRGQQRGDLHSLGWCGTSWLD